MGCYIKCPDCYENLWHSEHQDDPYNMGCTRSKCHNSVIIGYELPFLDKRRTYKRSKNKESKNKQRKNIENNLNLDLLNIKSFKKYKLDDFIDE